MNNPGKRTEQLAMEAEELKAAREAVDTLNAAASDLRPAVVALAYEAGLPTTADKVDALIRQLIDISDILAFHLDEQ